MSLLNKKKTIDTEIESTKLMIRNLEKQIDENANIKMKELDVIMDKIDELQETLKTLRDESRNLFNEASGCKIEHDARDITASCCIRGY